MTASGATEPSRVALAIGRSHPLRSLARVTTSGKIKPLWIGTWSDKRLGCAHCRRSQASSGRSSVDGDVETDFRIDDRQSARSPTS